MTHQDIVFYIIMTIIGGVLLYTLTTINSIREAEKETFVTHSLLDMPEVQQVTISVKHYADLLLKEEQLADIMQRLEETIDELSK